MSVCNCEQRSGQGIPLKFGTVRPPQDGQIREQNASLITECMPRAAGAGFPLTDTMLNPMLYALDATP
jgi:hypothetical protein